MKKILGVMIMVFFLMLALATSDALAGDAGWAAQGNNAHAGNTAAPAAQGYKPYYVPERDANAGSSPWAAVGHSSPWAAASAGNAGCAAAWRNAGWTAAGRSSSGATTTRTNPNVGNSSRAVAQGTNLQAQNISSTTR